MLHFWVSWFPRHGHAPAQRCQDAAYKRPPDAISVVATHTLKILSTRTPFHRNARGASAGSVSARRIRRPLSVLERPIQGQLPLPR